MPSTNVPLVSVVTPVFNGAQFLAQCIDSVLRQSYPNWQYTVVDNCSTDDTLEISSSYARRDPRVNVIKATVYRDALSNWNYAVSLVHPETRYCRILHADDYLLPDCLSKSVALAERNTSVSLVCSKVLLEKTYSQGRPLTSRVLNDNMWKDQQVVMGPAVVRDCLLRNPDFTCTPSSLLMRWDPERRSRPLYDDTTGIRSAIDRQVFFELLENGALGFVPEPLLCAREHPDSMTSTVYENGVSSAEKLQLLRRFGRSHMNEREFESCWKREMSCYYSFLGRSVFLFRGKAFWKFHRDRLRELDSSLSVGLLFANAASELVRVLGGSPRKLHASNLC
jgi:glycosyltransferase involved in cell wall biosynthesis